MFVLNKCGLLVWGDGEGKGKGNAMTIAISQEMVKAVMKEHNIKDSSLFKVDQVEMMPCDSL